MSVMLRDADSCRNTRWDVVGYFHADSLQETSSSERAQKDSTSDSGVRQSHKIRSNKF